MLKEFLKVKTDNSKINAKIRIWVFFMKKDSSRYNSPIKKEIVLLAGNIK
jgi:hypothetical protein